jgi:hypothetical protein
MALYLVGYYDPLAIATMGNNSSKPIMLVHIILGGSQDH